MTLMRWEAEQSGGGKENERSLNHDNPCILRRLRNRTGGRKDELRRERMSRRRRNDLPIILSHNTRTGIMTYPNRKMGGRDVLIVGLNREIPSGEPFALEDIEWTKAVLHIADVESLQITIDCLTEELKRWRKEVEG